MWVAKCGAPITAAWVAEILLLVGRLTETNFNKLTMAL
jgi:hypothetical protein